MQYTIRAGDTLYTIARRFGVTVASIISANPGIDPGNLRVGQVITIPVAGAPAPGAPGGYTTYSIRPGDALYTIARRFGTTVEALLRANPGINPSNLRVGQTIRVPVAGAPGPAPAPGEIVNTQVRYDYNRMVRDLGLLRQRYPFIEAYVIGRSVAGRNIWAIRLGRGVREVFYSGDWHANEILTGQVLMKFVEEYARAYAEGRSLRGYDVRYLFNNATIWVVPMVNPDGVNLVINGIQPGDPFYNTVMRINNWSTDFSGWSANIRGVDLNHQWPAQWERQAAMSPQVPSPRFYGGPYPLSEPEAQAIANFTRRNNFRLVIAVHSQGRQIFWGFEGLEPPQSQRIAARFAQLTGYTPIRYAASWAGYKDWFIQEYRRPGFTFETGIGRNPLPQWQISGIIRETFPAFLEAPLLV